MPKNHQNHQSPHVFLIGCLALHLAIFPAHTVLAREAKPWDMALGEDEQEFRFMGRCPDGATYRLHAYLKTVNDVNLPFYDYQGPAGVGTVKTAISPKVMAARVCRQRAEILDDPNLD